MTLCSFCNKRESRSRSFSEPNVCKECHNDTANEDVNRDGLTFIDIANKDDDDTLIATEAFINHRFQEIVNSSIKSQVKGELQNLLSDTTINSLNSSNKTNYTECNERFIKSLMSEIDFLRKELLSKDKIIELLIIDKNTNVTKESSSIDKTFFKQ